MFVGNDIQIQFALRLYPGLENIGDTYQYWGADTGEKIKYFWTKDSRDQVENYYSKFTFPFIDDSHFKNERLTVFNVGGSELTYFSVEGVEYKFNYPEDSYCTHNQRYKCINIRLRDLSKYPLVESPVWASPPTWKNMLTTMTPLALPNEGTLVTYSYYVNDF